MRKFKIEFYGNAYPLHLQAKNLHGAKIAAGRYIAKVGRPLKIANITEQETHTPLQWRY